jgi:hypothetical protein
MIKKKLNIKGQFAKMIYALKSFLIERIDMFCDNGIRCNTKWLHCYITLGCLGTNFASQLHS